MSIRLTAQLDARPAASGFVIEQTKGELMFAYGITADEAFDPPRSLSQDRNIKVRDIATRLTANLSTATGRARWWSPVGSTVQTNPGWGHTSRGAGWRPTRAGHRCD